MKMNEEVKEKPEGSSRKITDGVFRAIDESGEVHVEILSYADMLNSEIVDMHTGRRAQFVDRQGWNLPSGNSYLEVDQFDNEHARYIFGQVGNRLVMTCRCLPHEHSMVQSLWPEFLRSAPPMPDNAFEVSRLCAHNGAKSKDIARAICLARKTIIMAGLLTRYGIADKSILAVYKRLGIPPFQIIHRSEHPELYMPVWRETPCR